MLAWINLHHRFQASWDGFESWRCFFFHGKSAFYHYYDINLIGSEVRRQPTAEYIIKLLKGHESHSWYGRSACTEVFIITLWHQSEAVRSRFVLLLARSRFPLTWRTSSFYVLEPSERAKIDSVLLRKIKARCHFLLEVMTFGLLMVQDGSSFTSKVLQSQEVL